MKIYPSNKMLPENLRWMIVGWAAAYYYNNRLYMSNTKGVALSCGCCLDIYDEDGDVHCDVETHIKDWLEQYLKQIATNGGGGK